MAQFILTGFADEIGADLNLQMDTLDALNMKYIEMRNVDGKNVANLTLDEAKEIKARLDARGFKVSAAGSPIGKIKITDPMEPHLTQLAHLIEVAKILGTNKIRLFSFFVPEGEAEKYRDEVMNRMRAMQEVAKDSGMMLCHENEKDIYGDVASRCKDLFETLDTTNLGFVFDPSNFVQCGQDTVEAFEMMKPHLCYMHMKDSVSKARVKDLDMGFTVVSDAHRPCGQGDGNVKWILQQLVDMKFNCYLSVEPHLTNCDLVPGSGADKFTVAVNAVKGLLSEVGGTY